MGVRVFARVCVGLMCIYCVSFNLFYVKHFPLHFMYGKCDIKFDLIQRRSILTSSAHNRTSANRLWQMVGGADQRLHVGLPGPTGVGGTRVQHIFAQSRFFLSDSSEEICLYMTTQRLLVRFYFFFGETQNKRADSGG